MEISMNVYDFDGTIYTGDSSRDFYIYCLMRQPSLIKLMPRQARAGVAYLMSQARTFNKPPHERPDKTAFKEAFYSYLPYVRDITEMVDYFWDDHLNNLQAWYMLIKRDDDVIISASPVFLLDPICRQLNVRLIASDVNSHTGKCISLNCGGREKPIRFRERFPNDIIDKFYSDSDNDLPMAREATQAFKVKNGHIHSWKA